MRVNIEEVEVGETLEPGKERNEQVTNGIAVRMAVLYILATSGK